jgi:DNA-directed RNA polymerase subunit K/omega
MLNLAWSLLKENRYEEAVLAARLARQLVRNAQS